MKLTRAALCVMSMLLVAPMAFAQGATVAFGGLQLDSSLPVEVTADRLDVSQAKNTAVFSGNVTVGQGEMRLSADEVTVEYGTDGAIAVLHAKGSVVMVSGPDAAEADEATYTIASSEVVMRGDVILTQGQNALAGQQLVVDLAAGNGTMVGGVTTIFQPGGDQ